MRNYVIILVFMISAIIVSTANAACTQADMVGVWRIYGEMDDSEGRCTVVIAKTGAVTASSVCYLPGVISSTPFRGSLYFRPNCNVVGRVTVGGKVRLIDAWISKGKDSISGMIWNPAKPASGHVISGVKQ